MLRALFVIGLLQLVAVPTLTTPSPLPGVGDEFADQLKELKEGLDVPVDEDAIETDVDVDGLIDDLKDHVPDVDAETLLATAQSKVVGNVDRAVIDAISDLTEQGGVEGNDADAFQSLDELKEELLDELDDDVEGELKDLGDLADIVPTIVADVISDHPDIDSVDELVENLMNLGDTNHTQGQDSITGEEDDNVDDSVAGDDLVDDLLSLDVIEEVITDVVTDVLRDTEEPITRRAEDIISNTIGFQSHAVASEDHIANAGDGFGGHPAATTFNPLSQDDSGTTVAAESDYLDDVDYELVTEINVVTEVVYDVIPDDGDSESISVERSPVTGTEILGDYQESTSAGTPMDQDQAGPANERVETQPPLSTSSGIDEEIREVVTEIVIEYETETELAPDILATELRGLVGDDGDDIEDVGMTTETPATLFADMELELELQELEAMTNEMVDDDEPTFVFTTPYPSVLGSTERLDLGPDLGDITAQPVSRCPEGRFACADGSQCVLQDTVCDIMFDCADGSDENPGICNSDRVCPIGFKKCSKSPQCIQEEDWCDGVFHCYNGADEKNCMTCIGPRGDLRNLLIEDFCDGVQDCDDNHDETSDRCNNPCPLGFSKCADGRQCIRDDLFCNGFKNCQDKSDEPKDCARSIQECERFGMFSCDGICLIKSALCDEAPDCKDGVDERGCTSDIFACPDGYERSNTDHLCVHKSVLNPGR